LCIKQTSKLKFPDLTTEHGGVACTTLLSNEGVSGSKSTIVTKVLSPGLEGPAVEAGD